MHHVQQIGISSLRTLTIYLRRKKNVNNENDTKNKTTELSREQVVLWAYEAGFSTNFVRGEITRFEKLANLVKKYMERDYK